LDTTIPSGPLHLAAYLVSHAGSGPAPGVVLCHGFPTGPRGVAASASTFPELADRLARETGCTALAFNCRGTGTSGGEFSVAGWLDDIRAAVSYVDARPEVQGVWLVGVGEGGTLAVCEAASDPRVRGVATLAAPLTFHDWARDPARFLEYARRTGLMGPGDSPSTAVACARDLQLVDALAAAHRLAPRPLLVLHGSDDRTVPVDVARSLAGAAGPEAELRIVQAADHELRHDPRAIAALLGWLDRRAR
jgi:putative redox protein